MYLRTEEQRSNTHAVQVSKVAIYESLIRNVFNSRI